MSEPLESMVGEEVVLDTFSPIVYIGKLIELSSLTFVPEQTDMHDCRDGHASKEEYLAETQVEGVTVNRRRIVVMRTAVISVSRLADVAMD